MNMMRTLDAALPDARNSDPRWRARRDKLEMLLAYMELIPSHKVNLDHYMMCGTTGCIAGWACSIPAFKKGGLHLISEGDRGGLNMPFYRGAPGSDGLSEFFDIASYVGGVLFQATAFNKLDRTLLEERMGVKIGRYYFMGEAGVRYDELKGGEEHKQLALWRIRYMLELDDIGELPYFDGRETPPADSPWRDVDSDETYEEALAKGAVVFGDAD